MYRLSIDPGLSGTGLAVWDDQGTEADWCTLAPPKRVYSNINTYAVHAPGEDGWPIRMANIVGQINHIYEHLEVRGRVHKVYIEWPHFRGDEVGYTATSKGDIYKLSALIGGIMTITIHKFGGTVKLVPVTEWKGQLPKDIVTNRIKNVLGNNVCENLRISQHGWDAVGIGLYTKGFKF